MSNIDEYKEHVRLAAEHLDAAIAILEEYDLHYSLELKKGMLLIELNQKQHALAQKQVSLKGWLKGALGWKK